MKKNKKNIFLIRLNFILNFILLKYFKNTNSANKRKIIIHILKAHKIVLIYLNIMVCHKRLTFIYSQIVEFNVFKQSGLSK